MARPRTPAKILQLRGAYKKNPGRKRADAEGTGPFELDPPAHLPQNVVPAWRWIVSRLPKVALYNCDEVAVEAAARCLAIVWATNSLDYMKELRQYLGLLGMTPAARTKIPPHAPDEKQNSFAEFTQPPQGK